MRRPIVRRLQPSAVPSWADLRGPQSQASDLASGKEARRQRVEHAGRDELGSGGRGAEPALQEDEPRGAKLGRRAMPPGCRRSCPSSPGHPGWPSRRSSGSQTGTRAAGERAPIGRATLAAGVESGGEARERYAECRHGEERHAVRGAVVEADPRLLAPHAVGERPAARHDHRAPAASSPGRGRRRRAGNIARSCRRP